MFPKEKKTLLMGILNVNPDSFFDGGKYCTIENAIKQTQFLIQKGCQIIDVGGESTKPEVDLISHEIELNRIIPIISELYKLFRKEIIISIDTYKSEVALEAIQSGASIINDVSGLTMDKNMVHIVRDLKSKIIIMHNDGIPAKKPTHHGIRVNFTNNLMDWLEVQINYCIDNGIKKENIIVDPGIGFGKSVEEDLHIINNLNIFKQLGYPLAIGYSNKSFIKKLFPNQSIEKKSKDLFNLCLKSGVDIIRLH